MSQCAAQIDAALANVRRRLMDELDKGDHWSGRLSSSALSTATAAMALAMHGDDVQPSLAWLIANQNADGGWGDTDRSASNLATTLLVLSAFAAAKHDSDSDGLDRAREYVSSQTGSLDARSIAAAVTAAYGDDRTFATPILAACAMSGLLDHGLVTSVTQDSLWSCIPPLPFELAILPHRLLRWLRLPMVSYALPALIAIGAAVHHHRRPRSLLRPLRDAVLGAALRKLARIQPESGGFLEAAPLTSFVTAALISSGFGDHATVAAGVGFLKSTMRSDGSWPIDTNLATWVTTLAVNAMPSGLDDSQRASLRAWILSCQHKQVHPYTGAEAGGWAWTNLSGGVPDADDTAGAMLALHALGSDDAAAGRSAVAGALWLMGLQNRDGGIPTFCRGWGRLPFDRSCADLTAHALRAWNAWKPHMDLELQEQIDAATKKAWRFLARAQQHHGSFLPLWFGNENAPAQANPTYGTSRVLLALATCPTPRDDLLPRAANWLISAQGDNGGWGGAPGMAASIEETALAVEALATAGAVLPPAQSQAARQAVAAGVRFLLAATDAGTRFEHAPIGLYFASLWYYEDLYAPIFTAAALASTKILGR
ncbi:MAG: prenyltransferase/squalene oxidase repeat-containing protein [Planctomycetaceae bacterium]|nr:squalene--hopene cyclase [Planctomycetaceae bacterium]